MYNRDAKRAAQHAAARTPLRARSDKDTLNRDNTTKRGPKGPDPKMLMINHTHAIWCAEHGYQFSESDILSPEDYTRIRTALDKVKAKKKEAPKTSYYSRR